MMNIFESNHEQCAHLIDLIDYLLHCMHCYYGEMVLVGKVAVLRGGLAFSTSS
jgi:hypothetical protein